MPVENAPDWFLGNLLWRGITIPIVSFEAANEVPSAEISKVTRIAVLNGVSGKNKLSFYGVIVQGIPRLAALEQTDIQEKAKADSVLPCALSQTEIADQDAVIPDQVKIENMLEKAGAQTGGIY
jgi:chemosensory pili system protein ChpC